ncbi:helix-turn-helix domain-containing protein [Pseudonocardia sp. CA-107938]|uniref:helix-turn-helix domain-containing protein n=1 Tax=Pseudonocardia sp. CA-107938 TaxID=3240021 RepID=UPI003D8AA640
MSAIVSALAANVRRLRESHGFSLSQLSERSGIAKATLFKVEAQRTNPTLETIEAIADTFGVAVAQLIAIPERAVVEVLKHGEGQDISDDSSIGYVLRSQVIGAGLLEIHSQEFINAETSASHGIGAREHVLVREGSIRVGPVGEEAVITAGDYATYPADRPHRWQPVDGRALVWIVHTFPRAAPFVG